MPDIKVIDINNSEAVGIPQFNDSVSGVECLAQTAALMLLDPSYGNLESLLKKRGDNFTIGETILRAVDNVERNMLDEQADKALPENEVLSSLDILSIVVTDSNAAVKIRVLNAENDESIVTI